MNFRSSNKEKRNNHGHSPMRHMLHMVLCCGLPIVIILSLPFVAGICPGIAVILGVVAPFICPVMMGGMMLMMFSKNKSSCCEETKIETNRSEISAK